MIKEISLIRIPRKFVKALFKEFDRLKLQPLMGMETSKDEELILVWNDYYIYYQVIDSVIEVKAIYHQKENIN